MNSRTSFSSPTGIVGKDVGEFDAGARLGHHVRHRVTPGLVMRCFLVPGGVVRRAINLDQDKVCRIIRLLDHIKARDAWLLDAVASVFDRRLAKGLHTFRLDVRVNMDDEHFGFSFCRSIGFRKPFGSILQSARMICTCVPSFTARKRVASPITRPRIAPQNIDRNWDAKAIAQRRRPGQPGCF